MSNPAETYESYMVPALFGPWADRLVEAARPAAGERVLDVACGTGVVARRVAARVAPASGSRGKMVGLDLSPHMLSVARRAAEHERLAIEWREGRAEALPFADASFELVLCQFALMFFADRAAGLREMRRVLADGGRVVLSVWQGLERLPFYQALHDVIERRAGISSLASIFSLGDSDALRALLAGAGFGHLTIEPVSITARFPNPDAFLAGEIDLDTAAIPAMQHLDAPARAAITDAIREDMAAQLHGATEDDHVVLPFHAYFAWAHRLEPASA